MVLNSWQTGIRGGTSARLLQLLSLLQARPEWPGADLARRLDDDEAIAVVISLRTAASHTVTGIEETSVRALAKLEQVLPARLRERTAALSR